MVPGGDMAAVAALVGDPGRANMLAALMDGRALTATELAFTAGIGAATASGHLARLTEGGLLSMSRQGRHRYYGLASADVARMLESILVVAGARAPAPSDGRRATPRVPRALVECRSCYDHLAGRLAVALADALTARGIIELDAEAGSVTAHGHVFLETHGLDVPGHAGPRSRRLLCRPCLDWSERRPHLAGQLGARILDLSLDRAWIERQRDSRALTLTTAGRRGFADLFGLAFGPDGAVAPRIP